MDIFSERARWRDGILSVISDKKLPDSNNSFTFTPDVLSFNDYYPFGMLLPDRHGYSVDYRYGFNGMEKDDELKGEGNSYDYGARMLDPRIGRWFAPDPMEHKLPSSSTYSFANNNPVYLVDNEGELPIIPLLLKAGAAGAADMFVQVAMSYYFDDDVQDVGQAFDKVDWWQVTRSAAEGLIPWKTPGGKLGRAALTASGDVLINATKAGLNGEDYTKSEALSDFAVGFLGSLAGDSFGDLLTKYGTKKVARVLSNLGFDDKKIEEMFTGAGTTWKGKADYSSLDDIDKFAKNRGVGKDFTQSQKKNIKGLNEKANNGYLRDDSDGTFLNPSKKNVKGESKDMLQAEVDHIQAKNGTPRGTNKHSNAQVLSAENNLKKSNK